MLEPYGSDQKQRDGLKPKCGVDQVRKGDQKDQRVTHAVVDNTDDLALLHIVLFPKDQLVNCPFPVFNCARFHYSV
jgi:hypothetical protein